MVRNLHRLLPVVLVFVSGCGRGEPQVVPVTGTLKYKGQPVPNALLNFLPEKGRQSWAVTDAEGKFKINYDRHQDGAIEGKHKVWIEYRPTTQTEPGMVTTPKEMKGFFDKYSHANSKLEVQIDRDKKELDLNLD